MIWQKKFIENLEPEDYKLHSTKKLSIIIIHFVASVILDFTLLLKKFTFTHHIIFTAQYNADISMLIACF